MLPIRDDAPARSTPWIVFALIVLNTIVLGVEQLPHVDVPTLIGTYGLVPNRFVHWASLGGSLRDPWRYLPLVSAMFLHDGWLHLATNMLYLWTFGRALEARLGSLGIAATFILSGVAAALGQLLAHPGSNAAMVGASGAIAGLLGAYLISFPRASVTLAFPFYLIPWVLRVRAIWFLLGWFALQVGKGTAELLVHTNDPPVAWWAHVAGFVAGMSGALAGRISIRGWAGAKPVSVLAPAMQRPSQVPAIAVRPSRVPIWTDLRGSLVP